MKIPELLAPAGSLKSMEYAFAYGADAVYAGQPRYSLRVRNNEFHGERLHQAIERAHELKKRFFLTVNSMPHNAKLKTFIDDLAPVVACKPDALIMADPGLIYMVREAWPDMPIHLSVQANTVNYATVKFWRDFGVERIILSRELSLEEVEEIRQQCPDVELEVFVHGALCIAYSGRCLLSGYFNHRDPNQGTCTNSCRWEYDVHEAKEHDEGYELAKPAVMAEAPEEPKIDEQAVYFLEEKNRPGEMLPTYEDEHGTYIMNSKDLRAIEHVHRLTEIGVDCLKIEGRTKSHYYVARTAQSYRKAIDAAVKGEPLDPKLIGSLSNLANRGYTDGFFKRHHQHDYQNYMANASTSNQSQFVAEAIEVNHQQGYVEVDVKNHFKHGDTLEVLLPDGQNFDVQLSKMLNDNDEPVDVAPGSGYVMRLFFPEVAQLPKEKVLFARYL